MKRHIIQKFIVIVIYFVLASFFFGRNSGSNNDKKLYRQFNKQALEEERKGTPKYHYELALKNIDIGEFEMAGRQLYGA